jgi:UDP-N-acetylglucosamine diphosphorylase/glucosamine-1-phosphate N-acetyltransferase
MTRIVIMAAGKGTRMDSELPKVLVPLKGRPMIMYLMDSVLASGVDPKPIVVVSPGNKELIGQVLKDYSVEYIIQDEPLGTGHAVACAKNHLSRETENVLVLNGDHPFFKAESLKRIVETRPAPLILMTTKLSDFDDWRQNFYHWGRVIRDDKGQIAKIVEFKDASAEEQAVTEVNPNAMYFNKQWLLRSLPNLNNQNKSREYYLTDLIKIAFGEGQTIRSINIEPREAMGINSLAELKVAENLLTAA